MTKSKPILMLPPISHGRLQNFLGELLDAYSINSHGDIDGYDFQGMLAKHGLVHRDAATEADCDEDWAQDIDLEEGDTFWRYSTLMQRLMQRYSGHGDAPSFEVEPKQELSEASIG